MGRRVSSPLISQKLADTTNYVDTFSFVDYHPKSLVVVLFGDFGLSPLLLSPISPDYIITLFSVGAESLVVDPLSYKDTWMLIVCNLRFLASCVYSCEFRFLLRYTQSFQQFTLLLNKHYCLLIPLDTEPKRLLKYSCSIFLSWSCIAK